MLVQYYKTSIASLRLEAVSSAFPFILNRQ